MDFQTFIFTLIPPCVAVLTALFASISDAFVNRASSEVVQDFKKANLGVDVRSALEDIVVRVARGALLISNLITTSFSVITGLFASIYFLKNNFIIIFIIIFICLVIILILVRLMVQYGVTNLYVQKVRKPNPRSGAPRTFKITYGLLIDRALICFNLVMMFVALIVFGISSGS